MRFHYSFQVSKLLRDLKEEGAPLRRAIEALKKNLFPEDAMQVKGYPNRYEIFVMGYWMIYEVDQSGGETVIWVTAIEENK
jgi:hypothetical protein